MTTIDQDGKLINKVITAEDVQDIMRDAEIILFDDTRETFLTNKITQLVRDRLGIFDDGSFLENPGVLTGTIGQILIEDSDPLLLRNISPLRLISLEDVAPLDVEEIRRLQEPYITLGTNQKAGFYGSFLKQEKSRSQGLFPSKYKLDHFKKHTRVSTTKLAKRKKQAAQKRARKITKLCK